MSIQLPQKLHSLHSLPSKVNESSTFFSKTWYILTVPFLLILWQFSLLCLIMRLNIFKWFWTIFVWSSMKFLLIEFFPYFSFGLSFFLSFFLDSKYLMYYKLLLCYLYVLQIFSPSCSLFLFILFIVSLSEEKLLNIFPYGLFLYLFKEIFLYCNV